MPACFVIVDRDTPTRFPPSLHDWVPEDHLVHFDIDAIEQLDLRVARVSERGSGSEQYAPSGCPSPSGCLRRSGISSREAAKDANRRQRLVRALRGFA
jgi:hypothetical protein